MSTSRTKRSNRIGAVGIVAGLALAAARPVLAQPQPRTPVAPEMIALHPVTAPTFPAGPMGVNFGPGLHAAAGRRVDSSAYDRYIGRWSRLFVPVVLAAAEVAAAHRILDVATGPGEAASMALPEVGPAGLVVGADISSPMLDAAHARFAGRRFRAVSPGLLSDEYLGQDRMGRHPAFVF